jgi:hypothetical protein
MGFFDKNKYFNSAASTEFAALNFTILNSSAIAAAVTKYSP